MSAVVAGGPKGVLKLTVHEAKLDIDVQTIGKQDPYCRITIGGNVAKTKTKDGAGKTPKWEENFTFRLTGIQDHISVELYDENLTKDTFIASTRITLLSSGMPTLDQAVWYAVYDGKNKQQGQIALTMNFTPDASTAAPTPAATAPPQGYAHPPQGYAPPPQGYAPPPQGYAHPPHGYAPPPQGYAPPPQGYAPPPQGYAPPPQGYAPPPAAPFAAPVNQQFSAGGYPGARR